MAGRVKGGRLLGLLSSQHHGIWYESLELVALVIIGDIFAASLKLFVGGIRPWAMQREGAVQHPWGTYNSISCLHFKIPCVS
jgi:hypothetical protein